MSAVLLSEYFGPWEVRLLGDQYTGGVTLWINNEKRDLSRGWVRQLVEKLNQHLEVSEPCPRCTHGRLDHFQLWTNTGRLYGCSHGITDRAPLAAGLPCHCPGIPT